MNLRVESLKASAPQGTGQTAMRRLANLASYRWSARTGEDLLATSKADYRGEVYRWRALNPKLWLSYAI
jgi:hypothetical protein